MKSKTVGASTGLSIFLSSIASAVGLCCFAPWVVPLVGVSGAIMFARLGPYRPYFIGVATLFMALALFGAYRSRRTCIADAAQRRRRMWLNGFLAVGLLVLLLAIFAGKLEGLLESSVLP
jgi:hypothetical protein